MNGIVIDVACYAIAFGLFFLLIQQGGSEDRYRDDFINCYLRYFRRLTHMQYNQSAYQRECFKVNSDEEFQELNAGRGFAAFRKLILLMLLHLHISTAVFVISTYFNKMIPTVPFFLAASTNTMICMTEITQVYLFDTRLLTEAERTERKQGGYSKFNSDQRENMMTNQHLRYGLHGNNKNFIIFFVALAGVLAIHYVYSLLFYLIFKTIFL